MSVHPEIAAATRDPAVLSARSDAILAIRGLSVSYPVYGTEAVRAIRELDLSIARGEILGLVGESGSGKTTLARAIMGLLARPGRIDAGSVTFDGRDLRAMPEDALRAIRGKDIAMVIPNPRGELDPLVTVGRQIATVARAHLDIARDKSDELALEMLKAVQIPDPKRRFNAYPHELSGGMAQRVVMAMSLVCSPKFIISDDATSGLDVTVQAQILDLLRNLVRSHQTAMMFITRDIGITAHFCDRVAVIYAGEIVELAPTVRFFENPMHPYSVMLLAAFAHNPRLREKWHKPLASQIRAGTTGCPYAPRCVHVEDQCRGTRPALLELEPGHFVRCLVPVVRPT
ncbi:MAG: ABC transporter ATP-binding protein [Alphaproteobacteria bacterium]|nr:ABC transporter ATP-binding protein [Alphaproteobacteria bacterium]